MFFLLWLSFSCRFAFSQHAVSSSRYSGADGLRTASSTAYGIWWYVLWLHCLFEFIQRCFSVDLKSLVLTGGPPYPPNQYGGGRGNYDNFRGQGGYLGKPRNIRWDHCTCDLYLVVSYFCYWRNLKLLFKHFFPGSLFLSLRPPQNVTRWSTQHHWISWPGCTRWYGLLLEGSLGPFSLQSLPVLCSACFLLVT